MTSYYDFVYDLNPLSWPWTLNQWLDHRKNNAKLNIEKAKNALYCLIDDDAPAGPLRRALTDLLEQGSEYLAACDDYQQYLEIYGEIDELAWLKKERTAVQAEISEAKDCARSYLTRQIPETPRTPRTQNTMD